MSLQILNVTILTNSTSRRHSGDIYEVFMKNTLEYSVSSYT